MKTKTVILFFGSFNPIHNGHIAIADTVLGITGADELWFVVSPQNPFKTGGGLAPESDRLRMAGIAVKYAEREGKANAGKIKVCDIESVLPKPSWTANTLRALAEKYPDYAFELLIGSDNVDTFDQWKDFRYIIGNYPVLVYPRDGYEPVKKDIAGKLKMLEGVPLLPYAATDIRRIISQGEDTCRELPPPVWNYIKEKGLYGFGA